MKLDDLEKLNEQRVRRLACVTVTELSTGYTRLVLEKDAAKDGLAGSILPALATNKSTMIEIEGAKFFLCVHMPSVCILILGAVHISQALAPMAHLADFDVTIIDPRTAFATSERFPDIKLVTDWPDEALLKLGLDRYTAFVALTHDPKIDDMGLAIALKSECFYIGALGSRKSHAKRQERLHDLGFSGAETDLIRAPVGLNIGAISPAEIAVSILSEIIAALRVERVALKGREGQSLRVADHA